MMYIIVALILAVFAAVVLVSMRSGPHITTIEHRKKVDEPEVGDDA